MSEHLQWVTKFGYLCIWFILCTSAGIICCDVNLIMSLSHLFFDGSQWLSSKSLNSLYPKPFKVSSVGIFILSHLTASRLPQLHHSDLFAVPYPSQLCSCSPLGCLFSLSVINSSCLCLKIQLMPFLLWSFHNFLAPLGSIGARLLTWYNTCHHIWQF